MSSSREQLANGSLIGLMCVFGSHIQDEDRRVAADHVSYRETGDWKPWQSCTHIQDEDIRGSLEHGSDGETRDWKDWQS